MHITAHDSLLRRYVVIDLDRLEISRQRSGPNRTNRSSRQREKREKTVIVP